MIFVLGSTRGRRTLLRFWLCPMRSTFMLRWGRRPKEARLRYLRSPWAERLRGRPGIEILTPADTRLHGGITSFRFTGRTTAADNIAIARTLLDKHGIFTVHRVGIAGGACVRVTPSLFNSPGQVERLAVALEKL